MKSQLTTLNADEAKEVKGGLIIRPGKNNPIAPNLGKKLMWTITEQRGELKVRSHLNDENRRPTR